jgi:hypothetical protein
MPTNSNAIATLSVQAQDLLTVGTPNVVARLQALVTFPSGTAIQYAGYQQVTSVVGANLFTTSAVPFVYIRNANTSGSTALFLGLTPNGGGGLTTLSLTPGGIFLWANPLLYLQSGTQSANGWTTISYQLAFAGAPVTMEYLFAL